ncbi:MAG: alpha/beta fold hydrolase [Dehalococcoidia bacterium]
MQVGTKVTGPAVDCQYFGPAERQLFGIYEAPSAGAQRRCAVVLCYPFSREYLRCHRAYRQLAQRLSLAGLPVLRFDYYGFGDSAGDSEDSTIEGWIEDISAAVEQVQDKSSCSEICLVGLRLGASLAVQAATGLAMVRHLALWEPVTNGQDYLKELAELHRILMRAADTKSIPELLAEDTGLLGFPFTESLLSGLQSIDLARLDRNPADNVLVIEGNDSPRLQGLTRQIQGLGAGCRYQNVTSPEIWKDDEQALVPMTVIQAIVAWLAEVTA